MFVKRSVNPSLVETYEEENKLEVELECIKKHIVEPDVRNFGSKKPLLFTRPKEEFSNELEGVVKMVHKLSNKFVNLEKDKEAKKQFKPYYKRRDESGPSQPPTHSSSDINFTEVGMDNFCTFHKQPHCERNFPQWINSMNLVMIQLLYSKLTKLVVEGEKAHRPEEAPEETTMVVWDCMNMLGLDEE